MLISAAHLSRRGHKSGAQAARRQAGRMAPALPPRNSMTRVVVLCLAAVGLAGWSSPAAAQEALKAFSNPFLGSMSAGVRGTTVLRVDRQALRMTAAIEPARLSFSTATITGIPGRVSWNQTHTALAGAFVVTLLMDAGQTRELARRGWSGFREANPLLGERPSVGQVNTYTAIAGLTVLGAAAALPPKVRPWLLGAAIAVQAFTVAGSVQNGLPIRFP